MCGGSPSIGHRVTNLLESGLNCLKTSLLTPGPSKLCLEVSLYLPRVLPSPGVRSLPLSVIVKAPQLLLGAVHSVALEVQAAGHTLQVARESNAMRSLMGSEKLRGLCRQ